MLESLRASLFHHRRDILSFIVLAIAVILIFMPMMQRYSTTGDFPQHNQLALDFLANPSEFLLRTPHYLYHLFTALLYLFLGDISLAGVWLMLLCYIALAWLIYWQLRQACNFLPSFWQMLLCIAVSLSLLLLMPINIFTPENLYFGYIAPNVYHNPTVMLVKPFALLIFFMTLWLFGQEKELSRWWIIPFAILTYLSLVAKPSFMLAFVPTLGLICLYYLVSHWRETLQLLLHPLQILRGFMGMDAGLPRLMQRSFINWPVLLAGIVLPTFIGLYIQTLTWTSSGGIGFEPFRLFDEWSIQYEPNANKLLAWKLLMSSAFPLLVYLLYWKDASRSFAFNLGWRFYATSLAYAYLMVDYTDIDAGDFAWSAQIAAFTLFVIASTFLLEQLFKPSATPRTKHEWLILGLCFVVFIGHLIAGLHWYRLHMSEEMLVLIYQWW